MTYRSMRDVLVSAIAAKAEFIAKMDWHTSETRGGCQPLIGSQASTRILPARLSYGLGECEVVVVSSAGQSASDEALLERSLPPWTASRAQPNSAVPTRRVEAEPFGGMLLLSQYGSSEINSASTRLLNQMSMNCNFSMSETAACDRQAFDRLGGAALVRTVR